MLYDNYISFAREGLAFVMYGSTVKKVYPHSCSLHQFLKEFVNNAIVK